MFIVCLIAACAGAAVGYCLGTYHERRANMAIVASYRRTSESAHRVRAQAERDLWMARKKLRALERQLTEGKQ